MIGIHGGIPGSGGRRRAAFDPLVFGGAVYRAGALVASPVAAWPDGGAGAKTLTAVGTAPTWSAVDAAFGGGPSVTTSTGHQLRAATASDWTFLHDGTGGTLVVVCLQPVAAVEWVAGTLAGSGVNLGAELLSLGGGNVSFRAGNGSANVLQLDTAAGQFSAAVPHAVFVQYQTGAAVADGRLFVDDWTTHAASANQSTTPGGAAPIGPFTISGLSNAASAEFNGRYAYAHAFPAILTAAQRADYRAYITARYGV